MIEATRVYGQKKFKKFESCFTYEELHRMLCDIEHVVNSRSTTYVSKDYKELMIPLLLMFLQ